MKVSATAYGKRITIEIDHDELGIEGIRDEILIPLLFGLGYHQKNVNDLFFEEKVLIRDEDDDE
jgi:hypothetical protein